MDEEEFKCPEGYEECIAIKLISEGKNIGLDKTGNAHAILSGGKYMGEIYCSNPKKCIRDYINNSL